MGAEGGAGPPSSRGQALVDSSSPRYGEKASYYSAVCLETGEVEWMELEGNSNSGTSAAFLRQLRERHTGALNVIWDNAPAYRGEAVREYLRTSGLKLRLVNLPGYSPDFNADEAVWGWAREEATGNLCLGSRALVQERVGNFLAAAVPSCNQGLKSCCGIPSPIANSSQMHIPPWLWFRWHIRTPTRFTYQAGSKATAHEYLSFPSLLCLPYEVVNFIQLGGPGSRGNERTHEEI